MKRLLVKGVLVLFVGFNTAVHGLGVTELNGLLAGPEKPTLIDIRASSEYRQDHIPGAINIPVSLIPHKRLPPLGHVVVYGDGLDLDAVAASVESLNEKTGIEAESLEGGFGAWSTENLPSTRARGMQREKLRQLSYQELQRYLPTNGEITLVDLRRGKAEGLSDIASQFPEAVILKRPSERATRGAGMHRARRASGVEPAHNGFDKRKLYVLIDDGDGRAERQARRLRAAGVKRIAILAGGEQILQRQGRPKRQVQVLTEGGK
ncbi:MAG: hypothetical protein GY703_09695 [Gammaproteobacteria bacterium]|nr:hypothetical protein [Gammaproteobacteria bacterium]